MKITIAILLTLCITLSLTGCVSQSDLDAVTAENNALQADYEALQADYEAMQSTMDAHADLIAAMDAEDYERAMGIISEKQIAKQLAEKGNIEDYLVTVELTPENFEDYFAWKAFYNLDAFGEPMEHFMSVVAASKVYDQGLILYDTNVKIGLTFTFSSTDSGRTYTDTIHETRDWSQNNIFGSAISSSEGVVFDLDNYAMEVTRVEGTITFVKEEYVTSYAISESETKSSESAEITLVNGEQLFRTIQFGCKF